MSADAPAGGLEAVTHYLDEQGIRYEVVEHRTTYTAEAEARAAGVPPDDVAKTVVLRDGDSYRLAVIPASARLDLEKARGLFQAGDSLRLATEQEMAADFAGFEVGALPPIGPMLPAAEVLDSALLDHERIMFTGGDHRHGVLIDPNDLVEVTQARVADVRAG
jgi:Ala-tRNA(Pro) deacylase